MHAACRHLLRGARAAPRSSRRAPLPVRTRCGAQPAATPACRSRSESPTAVGLAQRRRRSARRSSSNRPGRGLRQRQPSSGPCGQKKTASMRPPSIGERAVHLGVDGVQRRHVEQAARQARLVGRDHRVPAGVVETRDRLERARDRHPFVGRLDVVVAVLVDRAVAVEDDRASCALRRRAATGRRRGSSSCAARPAAPGGWRAAQAIRR